MGAIINFLTDNYIYVVFVAVILVLGLVGYIVDSSKTKQLKKDLTKVDDNDHADIPIATIDANVKLSDSVNKMAINNNENVNNETPQTETLSSEESPKLGTLN